MVKVLPLELSTTQRRPDPSRLFFPKAPILAKNPRARSIPPPLVPRLSKGDTVFEAPHGSYLVFRKRRGDTALQPHLLGPDDEAARKLDVPPAWFPTPHAWTPDGKILFVACKHELWRVAVETGDAERVDSRSPGQRFESLAVVGRLLASEDSDAFIVRSFDGREVVRERGGEGKVWSLRSGTALLQSSCNVGRLYRVAGEQCELAAVLNAKSVTACWEEDGETWLNVTLVDPNERRDTVLTYRALELDEILA